MTGGRAAQAEGPALSETRSTFEGLLSIDTRCCRFALCEKGLRRFLFAS